MISVPVWLFLALAVLGAAVWTFEKVQQIRRAADRHRSERTADEVRSSAPPASQLPYGFSGPDTSTGPGTGGG